MWAEEKHENERDQGQGRVRARTKRFPSRAPNFHVQSGEYVGKRRKEEQIFLVGVLPRGKQTSECGCVVQSPQNENNHESRQLKAADRATKEPFGFYID